MRVSFGDCVLDLERRQLVRVDRDVHLTPKALDLLALLVAERPRAVAKAEIRDCLWPGTFVSESNLTTLVTELRAALGDKARAPRYLKTVQRFGYAFCGTATERSGRPTPGRRRGPHFTLEWAGGEVALRDGANVIGREEDAAAWIESASVSRRHARIVVSEGKATLEDLGSKNGTFVRGRKVTSPVALADGEEIRVGSVPLRFQAFEAADSTRTAARGEGPAPDGPARRGKR
jgi:DNA-binding winged helix-turn-helix (wHTH) protein